MTSQFVPTTPTTSASNHLQVSSLSPYFSFDKIQGLLKGFGISPFQDVSSTSPLNYYSSQEYLASTAQEKQDALWTEIMADTTSGTYPNVAGIFLESMEPTFDTKGDAMPTSILGTRPKYIHSVGAVGKVKFVPSGFVTDFSGIFNGADFGLIRLSSAITPSSYIAPGMGLKFLRNGMDSANLVSMYSVEGTPNDWNFFSKDFTTIIGASDSIATKALAYKFSSATEYIQVSGLANFAQYDQKGSDAGDNYKQPYMLRFEPAEDVSSLFPTTEPTDHMAYVDQMKTIPAGSTLYNVYGISCPKELKCPENEKPIGVIALNGHMTSSKWGDENLFFRHEKADDDIAKNPAWKDYFPKYDSLLSGCPFLKGFDI